MVFIVDDEASAETVLQDADIQYAMRPALTIRMENQPSAGVPAAGWKATHPIARLPGAFMHNGSGPSLRPPP